MKIFYCFLLALLVFVSCGKGVSTQNDNFSYHKFILNSENYYFFYPQNAKVVGERVLFSYDACKTVGFGNMVRFKEILKGREDLRNNDEDLVMSDFNNGELWSLGEKNVFYGKIFKNYDFGFWAFDTSKDISACVDNVDDLFSSLIDEASYMGNKYGFVLDFPDYFDAVYSNNTLVLKRALDDYIIEIEVGSFPNFDNYDSIADYIASEYSDFSFDFFDGGHLVGYYVDEASADLATRYFFTMNKSGNLIYNVSLKVPGLHFFEHLDEFESIIKTLDIF